METIVEIRVLARQGKSIGEIQRELAQNQESNGYGPVTRPIFEESGSTPVLVILLYLATRIP
jgi:hypothetical protein